MHLRDRRLVFDLPILPLVQFLNNFSSGSAKTGLVCKHSCYFVVEKHSQKLKSCKNILAMNGAEMQQ